MVKDLGPLNRGKIIECDGQSYKSKEVTIGVDPRTTKGHGRILSGVDFANHLIKRHGYDGARERIGCLYLFAAESPNTGYYGKRNPKTGLYEFRVWSGEDINPEDVRLVIGNQNLVCYSGYQVPELLALADDRKLNLLKARIPQSVTSSHAFLTAELNELRRK